MFKNIGFAITGSFCTHNKIIAQIQNLVDKGYNVIPIFSQNTATIDTRFGTSSDFTNKIKEITGKDPICSLVDAEPVGPKNMIDVLIIAPATGNTIAKLANAISDTAVTMVAKSLMRNNKPVIVGISSNDALGFNLENISKLLSSKGIFFIPFGQDDPENKPKSLIANWDLIEDTLAYAEKGKQIQPLLIRS